MTAVVASPAIQKDDTAMANIAMRFRHARQYKKPFEVPPNMAGGSVISRVIK